MVQPNSVEFALEFSGGWMVGGHLGLFCVECLHDLLYHEIWVASTDEVSNACGGRDAEPVEEGLVLGSVVGVPEVELQNIVHFVTSWGHKDYLIHRNILSSIRGRCSWGHARHRSIQPRSRRSLVT